MDDAEKIEDEADFEKFESFDVDQGELDGLSPQECFVLGWELCNLTRAVERGKSFDLPFHSNNENRVRAMLDRRNVDYQILIHDDWPTLVFHGV